VPSWVAARRAEGCHLEKRRLAKTTFPKWLSFFVEQSDDLEHPPDDSGQIQRAANLTITGLGLTII
jgi:hypothetical protein